MQGKEGDPAYLEYRVQPGIIDLYHLELVALKRVAVGLWMPYFRLIAPNGIRVPQRRYRSGAKGSLPNNHNLVSFIREGGSYITLTSALWSDYAGLLNSDTFPSVPVGPRISISLRIEVSAPYHSVTHRCSLVAQWPGYPSQSIQAS